MYQNYQNPGMLGAFFVLIVYFSTDVTSSPITVEQFSSKINQYLYNENATSNAIWSPVSVYSSLLPFLAAASGPTLSELQTVLGIQSPEGLTIDMIMNDANLQICTGLFVQKNVNLGENFLSAFKSVHTFQNSSNLADNINAWMKNVTNGLIPKIVEQIQENVKLVVVNGVGFKGTWRAKFRKDKIMIKPFYGIKNITQVEMMQQKSVQNYGRFSTTNGEDFEVMKMGYRDSAMHIIVVVPEKAESLINIYRFVKNPEFNKLGEILERLEPTELEIQVPKMRVESNIQIHEALEKAGLKSIFSPMTANLFNMFEGTNNSTNSTIPGLHVDDLVHKTVLELDEEGTKASAGTAAIFLPLSGLTPKVFIVDKPFIVFLRWEGKWTFFEGIITDVEASHEIKKTSEVPIVQSQSNLDHEGNNATSGVPLSRRNNGDEKWWVQNGPPEYLSDGNQEKQQNNERFQQPEPKDPHGIRFPNPSENSTRLKHKFLGSFHGEKIVNPVFVSEE